MQKAASSQSLKENQQSTKGFLPRLQNNNSEQQLSTYDGQPQDNPFYVPEDYEIFKMKEKEKEIRKIERESNQNLKIWEKGIKNKGAYTIEQLNQLCKIEEENEDEYSKLNIVDAAKSAIKNRVRQKEPMHQFIDKKREMLLFQMLIDHKREQINNYEELTRLHRRGLEKCEQMLEEDLDNFNKFLEENKNNSRQAIKAAEDETKKKQEKQVEIKALNELRSDLQTKNIQKLENLEDLWKYKTFLDKVTPKDYQEEQHRRLELKRKMKQQMGQKQGTPPQQIKKIDAETYSIKINQQVLDILEDSDEEYETYFKKPEQLEEIFLNLEEKNLFLITNTKEREQQVEDMKHHFDKRKVEMEQSKEYLIKQKNELQKQIDSVNDHIRHLKQVKGDNGSLEQLRYLENEIIQIHNKSFNTGDRSDKSENIKGINGIDVLQDIEKKLEILIRELKNVKANFAQKYSKQESSYKQSRNIEIKKMNKESENKTEKLIQKLNKPIKEKRQGRPIMKKTIVQQKVKAEKNEEKISEEELDRIKYFQ